MFKTAGIATLLTTQHLEEAGALSDRIIVIDRGTIVAQGTADDLKKRTAGRSVKSCRATPPMSTPLQMPWAHCFPRPAGRRSPRSRTA